MLIGSYTLSILCAMPIEMDGNALEMLAACSAVIQFYPTGSHYSTMYLILSRLVSQLFTHIQCT